MLQKPPFDNLIKMQAFMRALGWILISEAHVPIIWGINFRQDYMLLGILCSRLPQSVTSGAWTATPSKKDRPEAYSTER